MHAPVALGRANLRPAELFHDHERLEALLFEGVSEVTGGSLASSHQGVGYGLALTRTPAEPFRIR
jgi:hypothetical protein